MSQAFKEANLLQDCELSNSEPSADTTFLGETILVKGDLGPDSPVGIRVEFLNWWQL